MNIEALFDYQKIAQNERLSKMIEEVENKYGIDNVIDDEELDNVAGGRMNYNANDIFLKSPTN